MYQHLKVYLIFQVCANVRNIMGVLSAPSTSAQIHVLSAIIVTVSVLSATGAGWIILSFLVSQILNPKRMW